MCDYNELMVDAINCNKNDEKWTGSIFEGIKLVSNTAVGNVGQTFVRNLCSELGFENEPPYTPTGEEAYTFPWDLKIEGITFEIKTASEDVHGRFQFNHVRLHRNYDALLCIGICPNSICFQVWTKAEVATDKAGTLTSMEKGGASDFKLSKGKKDMLSIEEFKDKMQQFISTFK